MTKILPERMKIIRIIDANLNRANEAARVVEDFARFVLDHSGLANMAKSLRHRLASAASTTGLSTRELLSSRDTASDVGTELVGAKERKREDAATLLRANFQRLEQALRVLEEYSKLIGGDGAAFESMRYDAYTLEKDFASPRMRPATLDGKNLMVLVGTSHTRGGTAKEVLALTAAVLKGGCKLVELREKDLPDAEFLAIARAARELTRKAGATLIVNDRADIAKLSHADGVHLGLNDLSVADARRILGPSKLIGMTAHSVDELKRAEASGADYIGIGTMFASPTKPKLGVKDPSRFIPATLKCSVPCFVIGGINRKNVGRLLTLGATRVAVGSAIATAKDVTAETKWFVKKLQ